MSVFCGVCNGQCDISKDVKCKGECGRYFHVACVRDHDSKKTRSVGRDWKCKDCRNESSASSVNSVEMDTVITKDFLLRVLNQHKQEFSDQLTSVRSDITELKTSTQYVSDQSDKMTSLMAEIKAELAAVKKENEQLRCEQRTLNKGSCRSS